MSSDIAISKVNQFKAILNSASIKAQIKNSMKENSGAFLSSMLDLYSGDPYLQNCDPALVAQECLKAAALKLPITKSLGFAYVVPYKNVPTFIIGYKGLIQLAQRSGFYRTINAGIAYEGEFVGVNKLTGDVDLSGERAGDEVEGYFAYFKLLNGFKKTVYVTKKEMIAHMERYSPSATGAKAQYSPWRTEFDKMAQKTVLRKLIGTYGVMSIEMQNAVVNDGVSSTSSNMQREAELNANKITIDTSAESLDNPSINNTAEPVENPMTEAPAETPDW